jgi:hypothetical protein
LVGAAAAAAAAGLQLLVIHLLLDTACLQHFVLLLVKACICVWLQQQQQEQFAGVWPLTALVPGASNSGVLVKYDERGWVASNPCKTRISNL